MDSPHRRDAALALAATDWRRALKAAGDIPDAWYRAQALAWVARSAEPSARPAVLDKARAASGAAKEPYKTVGSAAWWIRVLIEVGEDRRAVTDLPDLLRVSTEIENTASRVDALFLLFQAAFPSTAARKLVLDALVPACLTARSWRGGRSLRDALVMLANEEPTEAKRLLDAMPEGKYRRGAARLIAAGTKLSARRFFW